MVVRLLEDNIASVNKTLSNIAALTSTFESRNKEIEQMVADLPVTMAQVREIAEKKMVDLNANDLEKASKMIAGSARSMGVKVRG